MARRKIKTTVLPPETIIDVEMRKKMRLDEYENLIKQVKKKGWEIQGYQVGFKNEL